jgi:hypothetical protein
VRVPDEIAAQIGLLSSVCDIVAVHARDRAGRIRWLHTDAARSGQPVVRGDTGFYLAARQANRATLIAGEFG